MPAPPLACDECKTQLMGVHSYFAVCRCQNKLYRVQGNGPAAVKMSPIAPDLYHLLVYLGTFNQKVMAAVQTAPTTQVMSPQQFSSAFGSAHRGGG